MATYQIFGATSGPGAQTSDSETYSLGLEFYVTQSGCTLTEIRFWASQTMTGSNHASRLWLITGTTSGTLVSGSSKAFPSPLVAGWNTVVLDTPIALTVNQRYRATVYFTTDNGYTATSLYWSTGPGASGITNGPLVAPNATNATGTDQGAFTSASDDFPSDSFNAANYWIDVTIDDGVPTLGPPTVNALGDRYLALGLPLQRTAIVGENGATVTAQGWTLESGTGSPSTLSTTVDLNWTPSSAGVYGLRFSATNSQGTTTQDITITVVEAPLHTSAMTAMISRGRH